MNLPVHSLPINGLRAEKLKRLKEHFILKYNCPPSFYVRAPGRVNLIGEHIDYSGYAVFPMAILQDIMMAVSVRDDNRLFICNVDPQYESFECDIDNFQISGEHPNWYKYILCGIKGVVDECGIITPMNGLSLTVYGDIPPAAGLSSSSALVCASALALTYSLKVEISMHSLAELCASAERYIGTQGGGMDQAASLLSNAGSAQLIEFNPLQCTPVFLPDGATFVVVDSEAGKQKASTSEYNTRVVECRLACRILTKQLNVDLEGKFTLGFLQKCLEKSFSEMVEIVKEFLHSQPYSKLEICQLLHFSVKELEEEVLSSNTRHLTEFQLYKRALHVFTEASRVWEFKRICDDWNAYSTLPSEGKIKVLQKLGKLMNESHSSLQRYYECSHPKLDHLVELSKELAFGTRLTGAGWGGCVVSLVSRDKVEEYSNRIMKEYFGSEEKGKLKSSAIFSTEPSDGACVYLSDKI